MPRGVARLCASARRERLEYVSLAEIGCRPQLIRHADWRRPEEGLAVELRTVLLRRQSAPTPDCKLIGTLSVHAIARCYQRGGSEGDQDVLREVYDLAQGRPEHGRGRPGEFRAGAWRGQVGGVDHSLNARTFIPELSETEEDDLFLGDAGLHPPVDWAPATLRTVV